MWTRDRLIAQVAGGTSVDFLFFWGHKPRQAGVLDGACFSQWYPSPFTIESVPYPTAEHYMMAEKGRLFGDAETVARILTADTPAAAKALGREVRGYDDARWDLVRFDLVVRGNLAKFGQNDALRSFLLATGERVLVEASPTDTIWGIGLGAASPEASDPARWRGRNLLGFALMEARERLRR